MQCIVLNLGAEIMAKWAVTFEFEDVLGGRTSKRFIGDFVDYAAASTAAGLFQADVQNLVGAALNQYTLCEIIPVASAPSGTSNVFERVSATVDMGAGKLYNLQMPSPVAAVFAGNALDPTATQWVDFVDNLTTTSGWEISDGEHYDSTVAGKRIFVRSGKTNLP
jgi:hypothetical protein